jgi:hypothetical protein
MKLVMTDKLQMLDTYTNLRTQSYVYVFFMPLCPEMEASMGSRHIHRHNELPEIVFTFPSTVSFVSWLVDPWFNYQAYSPT